MKKETLIELYLRHQKMLEDYIFILVRNRQDAEDLSQETGIVILSGLKYPENELEFPAWARGVARNKVLHCWRKQRATTKVNQRMIDVMDCAYEEADPDLELWEERRQALTNCMDKLPSRSRAILQLRYTKELKSEKIGNKIKKSAANVRMLLTRIRTKLHECIEGNLQREMS